MSDTAPISDVKAFTEAFARTRAELAAAGGAGVSGPAPSACPELVERAADTDAAEPAESPSELDSLPAKQRLALEELMSGRSYTEAAYNAGIDRRTLYRWINHSPAFRAALEAWRERAIGAAEHQLTLATELAVETLRRASCRDFRAAALLLKGRGLLSGTGPGRPRKTPIEMNHLPIPSSRIGDFEVRLRELILSFREEPKGEVGMPGGKEVTTETPGSCQTT